MKADRRRWALVAGAVVLAAGLIEIALGLLALVSPEARRVLSSPRATPQLYDARLGFRPNPAHPGHDRKGFRNPVVPARAQVVALGDSQTYGTGVEPEAAWPRRLESMTGKTVYSMAFGGYGPTHSLALLEEALAFSPEVVVATLYAGNDLYDSFNHVYNQGGFPELRSADPLTRAAVERAEETEPVAERVNRLFSMGARPPAERARGAKGEPDGFSPKRLLAERSRLAVLLRRAWHEVPRLLGGGEAERPEDWETIKRSAALNWEYCRILEEGSARTVLTCEYRLAALSLGDPRILEGLRISLRAMRLMKERAAAGKVRFLVLLLPTKEMVFFGLAPPSSPACRALAESEGQLWATVKESLGAQGIEVLDALPTLRAQLAAVLQPYRISADGHPNEHGHRAVAELVASALRNPASSPDQAGPGAAAVRAAGAAGH